MKLLSIAIAGYITGLAVFYTCALFGTYAWDVIYFGWAKLFDMGLVFWAFFYFYSSPSIKRKVKWLFLFSVIRFVADVQSFYTGTGVNNQVLVAALFLILILITGYLVLMPSSRPAKWLSKNLFKSD